MARPHGPWMIEASSEQYKDEFVRVSEDRVTKPDGQPGTYATVTLKPGVAILPVDSDGRVYLTKQFRYAVSHDSIEVPCGAVNDGEEPLVAAKREIKEELGIEADNWIPLGRADLDTSIVRCAIDLFIATDLRFTQPHQDATEDISPVKVPLAAAVAMVMNTQITHAASCLLILKAERYLTPV